MTVTLDPIESAFAPTADGKCAEARSGMVASAFPEATIAGVEMLQRGGNAVDAACAAGFALCVCEPQACSLGGQTMAVLHMGGRTVAVDGSSRLPAGVRLEAIGPDDASIGYRATTVPSTPAVLGRLHRSYGRLPWRTILAPAIAAARNGYTVTALQNRLQRREMELFRKVPSQSGARYFLKGGRRAYAVGDTFRQPELGALLQRLAAGGPEIFYGGETARMIAEDMQANGGFLTVSDLAAIPWPVDRPALRTNYRGLEVVTLPPPAPGRILLLILAALDRVPSDTLASGSPPAVRLLIEVFRRAFAERRRHPIPAEGYRSAADPAVADPAAGGSFLLAAATAAGFDPAVPTESDGGETTHLSVMDRDGNAVGITQSVNMVYGAKAAAEGLGFLYNNYMIDMETRDARHPHFVKPHGTPWSYTCPTIVCRNDRPWLVTGSPGSERILSTITQFLINIADKRLPICEAMKRPRLHCTPEGVVSLEADRFEPEVIRHLERFGYRFDVRSPYSFYLGAVHAVLKRQSGGGFQGVAEIRRDGTAAGI